MPDCAGLDEAGRGALAGPVVAAAVILDPKRPINGLNDSKQLSAAKRERLHAEIIERAKAWAIAEIDQTRIDQINILQASMEAMSLAVSKLPVAPAHCRVDGNRLPRLNMPATAVVGGDGLHAEIMAASILAKVHRDRLMVALSQRYPDYGFEQHKGYPTQAHRRLLKQFGPCAIHRRSYAPVAQLTIPGIGA